jgi:hypothetical protein
MLRAAAAKLTSGSSAEEIWVKEGSMLANNDLGAAHFKTWSNTQRRDEIAKLVEGYRNGLPVGILCSMAEAIAGSRKRARKYLQEMLTAAERQAALDKETGGMLNIVQDFLL